MIAHVRAKDILKLAGDVCLWLVFGCAMCDCTFAHFLKQNDQIMLFLGLRNILGFFNVLSCLRSSYTGNDVLKGPTINDVGPFFQIYDPLPPLVGSNY